MKRNLVLIAGITIAMLVMMLLGNVITVAEKLGEVCHTVYVEYAFYGLILILAVVFIIRPIIRVHNAPEFPVMAVDDEAGVKDLQRFGKRLCANCGYISDPEKRKAHQDALKAELKTSMEDREKLKEFLNKELDVRFKGNKELDVLGIDKRIKEWGKTVFLVTAISQNGIFDSAAVMVMNYKLIEDLVLASGFRPTRPQMFRLYVRVLTTALISYCTSQVFTDMDGVAPFDVGGGNADLSDVNPEDIAGTSPELDGEDSLTGFLSRFKIPGVVAESALQGAVNALLALRIGYVTKAYLQEGQDALSGVRNKRAVKRQAIKSAFKALPGIVAGSASTLGKGITGFVARMASKDEKVVMEKKLYPFKFIPVASRRPWGGNDLVKKLGKQFVECDEDGNEVPIAVDELVGESWELADMGIEDSVIANGWLAGNTISELMETYLERVVGEDVYNYYGRQFPLLIKFLDINDKLSVQVHPDDEVAAERYDSLGKSEIWYVMDAKPGAKMYCGFTREVTAQEFYDRCHNGTVEEILNVIYPKKGDVIFITPGTVHAADGGLLIAEIQESSDMTFRLYDWGREFDPTTARKTHLEEAIDVIDYRAFDPGIYRKGPLWGEEASNEPCRPRTCSCDCGDDCDCECHCHEHHHHHEGGVVETLVESPQFNVSKLNLTDPLHIYTEKFESFIVYICLEGAASIQVPSTKDNGEAYMHNYEFAKGETILVPADMPDFFLVPRDRSTVLLEAVTRPVEEQDQYIDPDTEAFLENEDYEGLEDECCEEHHSGSSPLGFFGSGHNHIS